MSFPYFIQYHRQYHRGNACKDMGLHTEYKRSQASSSGVETAGFYDGAGVNDVEVESRFEDSDPTVGELRGCDMLEDVMDIVTEEAGLMSTAGVAFAISR